MRLSDYPAKLAAVRANVFGEAHHLVPDWDRFFWHTYRGTVDADVLHSSQALCMSVWGTVANGASAEVRAAVGRACGDPVIARALEGGVGRITLELDDRDLLNERGTPQASSLDVVMEFDSLVVVVESKLGERLGDCYQRKKAYCSGVFGSGSDLKLGTAAPCRLQVQDNNRTPRHYWTVMDALAGGPFVPLGSSCPFQGPGYQVMRTIASASRLGEVKRKDWRVLFAFPFSLGGSTPTDVAAVRNRLLPVHRSKIGLLDYDALSASLASGESPVARDLGRHIAVRIVAAAK